MPIIPNPGGSVNPNQGMVAESTFQPADSPPGQDGTKGHVPGPATGIDGTYFLAADATWKKATAASLIPVIVFTGSAAGGANQTFTSTYFNGSYYTLAEDIQLFIQGTTPIKLFGNTVGGDFTLNTATSSITVSYALPANARLFIDSKVITNVATNTYYILTELGDILNAENADRLRKEQNT